MSNAGFLIGAVAVTAGLVLISLRLGFRPGDDVGDDGEWSDGDGDGGD